MADILFANTYFLKHDLKEYRNMNLYAPLGTLYAAAYVMQKGYSAALFDTMLADSEEDLTSELRKHKPKYMVIYDDTFNYLTKMCLTRMRDAAFRMSEIAKDFGCTVIVSGSDSADHLEKYFTHKVDYAICGEGEQTLGELLDFLIARNEVTKQSHEETPFARNEVTKQSHEETPFARNEVTMQSHEETPFARNKVTKQSHDVSSFESEAKQSNNTKQSLNDINGLAYFDNGKIKRTAPRKVLKELDTLPYPAWELVDLAEYRRLWLKHHGYFSMNLVTTRGCPFHCNWCAKPIYGQVYNSHSPEYISGQVKLLKEKYSADHIWFCDDIFGLKPGWTTKFDEVVNKNNSKLPFKCLSRADLLLKEDNISHLASAGCESIWIGAESGSQKILDAMDKGTTIAEIYESTRLLKKHGIKTCFFLQFGYTGETMTEINETIKMVIELMPDDIGISVSYPLPGTKFYDRVAPKMKQKQNWELSDDFEMMFDGTYSTEFYRVLHKRVHKEYRTRQLLHEPLRRFTSLWKLPIYAAGWASSSMKLKTKLK